MPKAKDTNIPVAFLRECFDLDAEAGVLTWRARPREHFATQRAWTIWNVRRAGKVAGSLNDHGYLITNLTFNGRARILRMHRIIFALVHGRWPTEEVDHRNGLDAGNGIGNLREATHRENSQNGTIRRNNASGFLGVVKTNNRWAAFIKVNYRSIRLGYFDTPEEAGARYLKAKAELHTFQPTPRSHLVS
jgi:HNH endonuclease